MISEERIDTLVLRDGWPAPAGSGGDGGTISLTFAARRFGTTEVRDLISRAVLNSVAEIKLLSHRLCFGDARRVRHLSSVNKWEVLSRRTSITAFKNLFLELTHDDDSISVLYTNRPITATLDFEDRLFVLQIIHDAPFVHPTWDYSSGMRVSSAAARHPGNTTFEAVISMSRVSGPVTPSWISCYPNGARACFVLTDHSDFDSAEKLDVFLQGSDKNGWLGRGLKITKGVFTYGPGEEDTRKSHDLEVERYKELVDELYRDGSEVCPHALKHSGQLSPDRFHNGLDALHRQYKPRTWIDHGANIKYCYSQNGHLDGNYRTLEALRSRGYNSLWSFHDTNLDPSLSLNFFNPKKYDVLCALRVVGRHLARARLLFALHYVRSYVRKNYAKSYCADLLAFMFTNVRLFFMAVFDKRRDLWWETKSFFSRLVRFSRTRGDASEHFTPSELNDYCPPLFTDRHQSINNYKDGLFFFNTTESTHCKDIYTARQLDDLIEAYGLHIGHTYVLNSLPYINGIFRGKESDELSQEWMSFTEELSERVRLGKLWNPNMGDLVERVKLMLNVEMHYCADGLAVANNNGTDVTGVTLFCSGKAWVGTVKASGGCFVPFSAFA